MNDVTKFENLLPTYERPLNALEIRSQVNVIQEVLRDVMKDNVHYGYPPGTAPKNAEDAKLKKPSLLKPGAELLCVVFRLDPQYSVQRTRFDGGHLEVVSTATLFYIPNGMRVGSGMGSATTEESKHAYRWAARKCPHCNAEAIIKGREEFGGGWLCFERKGGCRAKFNDDDPAIVGQDVGRVINPDLPDQHNTVLKMANKRAIVAAVLTATAASDMFSQDIEDLNPEAEWTDDDGVVHQGRPKAEQRRRPQASQSRSQAGQQSSGAGNPDEPASAGMLKNIEGKLKALAESAGANLVDLTAECMKANGLEKLDGITAAKGKELQTWIRQKQGS